jgi:hypothetical protein
MPDELLLPRLESAEVPAEKLRDYALNPAHPTGRHKARVFESSLGIGKDDWEFLRDQILDGLALNAVTAIRPKSPYGAEYEVKMTIEGLNGENHRVITGWLLPQSGAPRLLTAYVELPRRAG